MKNKALYFVVLLLVLFPVLTFAATFKNGESIAVSTPTNDDLYSFGSNVSITSQVMGDIVSAGGTVLVSGSTTQGVNVAGGTISILGTVGDDVRAVGGTINVQSKIAKDLVVAGGQINILEATDIGRDLAVMGGELSLSGVVHGKANITSGKVYINSRIDGNVAITGDKIILGPNTNIAGNLSYKSPNRIVIESGALVRGNTEYTYINPESKNTGKGRVFGSVYGFMAAFVLAFVLNLIFRKLSLDITGETMGSFWKNLLKGFIILIVVPIASIIVCVTIIGIPFAVVVMFGYVSTIIISAIFAPILLGSLFMKWRSGSETYTITWLSILIGALIWSVIGIIPILGGLVRFVVVLALLGAIGSMVYRAFKIKTTPF